MTNIQEEAANTQSRLEAALDQGVGEISNFQEITFTLYKRLVLPVDGFVFWVLASTLSPGALYNEAGFNGGTFNKAPKVATPATTLTVQGSLHYSSAKIQDETQNYAVNRIIFTALQKVEPLQQIGPDTLWIATFRGMKFAFGAHGLQYQAAGLWHYTGDAVYPDLETQLVDGLDGFNDRQIVSNSLPIWLSMNSVESKPWNPFINQIPLYPSYVLPANKRPPWGAVHIEPEGTTALAMAPFFDRNMSHSQLCRDRVKVTLYGVRNDEALDFADFVQQYSQVTEAFGITNCPVIRDEKRVQSELNTLSQKKSIEFEVNYHQRRANDFARKLIKHAFVTVLPNPITTGV